MTINDEDKELFWATVGANIQDRDGNLIPASEWGERGLYALRSAEPELYDRLVERFVRTGFQSFTKSVAKKNMATVVATVRGKRKVSRYVSVIDDQGIERQKLVENLTLIEVGNVKVGIQNQIDALGFNVAMCDKLIALCVSEKASTVADALASAGRSIDEVMAEC